MLWRSCDKRRCFEGIDTLVMTVWSPNNDIISKVFLWFMQHLATGALSMWLVIASESTEQLSWMKIKPSPTIL